MRPATYESAAEADVLLDLLAPRDGVLRNTVFCLLDAEAKPLSRAGRSPEQVFGSVENVIVTMRSIEARLRAENQPRILPEVPDLRLGLNIAACDDVPLVVCMAKDEKHAEEMRGLLAEHAWREELMGRAHYLVLVGRSATKEVRALAKTTLGAADVVVLRPDAYGLDPRIVATTRADSEGLLTTLGEAVDSPSRAAPDSRSHIRTGQRNGIEWESAIPPTDGPEAEPAPGKRSDGPRGRRRGR